MKETLPAAFYKGTTEFNGQVENGSNVAMVEDGGIPSQAAKTTSPAPTKKVKSMEADRGK